MCKRTINYRCSYVYFISLFIYLFTQLYHPFSFLMANKSDNILSIYYTLRQFYRPIYILYRYTHGIQRIIFGISRNKTISLFALHPRPRSPKRSIKLRYTSSMKVFLYFFLISTSLNIKLSYRSVLQSMPLTCFKAPCMINRS